MQPKFAYLFPGQGTLSPEVGTALAKTFPQVRDALECASQSTQCDLSRMLRTGARELQQTEIAQPLLTALALGAWRAFQELYQPELSPSLVAGHSLGELSACCVAGGYPLEQALSLAHFRGQCMAQAAAQRPGGMATYTGSPQGLQEILQQGRSDGLLEIAAYNAPQQWTLTGEEAAIRAILSAFSCTRLDTSGPWHCELMRTAVAPFRQRLQSALSPGLQIPLVSNFDGSLHTTEAQLSTSLPQQLVSPIQWMQVLHTLQQQGVTAYILFPPTRTLRHLLHLNLPRETVFYALETPRDFEQTARSLSSNLHLSPSRL